MVDLPCQPAKLGVCLKKLLDCPCSCVSAADALLQVKSAEEFASRVNNSGGLCDLHIYEGAGHAFLNKPDSK